MKPVSQIPDSATRDEQAFALTADERNSVRAFLARGETRLSTIHRIATIILLSIGFMSLTPILITSDLGEIVLLYINQLSKDFTILGIDNLFIRTIISFLLSFPTILSFMIIFRLLIEILKNTVIFYFSTDTPGLYSNVVVPSLTLTGMNFPPDESRIAKVEILRRQYTPKYIDYVLSVNNESREKYFGSLIEATKGEIIPRERNLETLSEEVGLHLSSLERQNANYLNASLGVAKSIDRTVIQEAATLESTLARCVVVLRKIVFHYFQLVISIFFTLFSIISSTILLKYELGYGILIISAINIVWSLTILKAIDLPVRWLKEANSPIEVYVDKDLTFMQRDFRIYCILSTFVSFTIFISSVIIYLNRR